MATLIRGGQVLDRDAGGVFHGGGMVAGAPEMMDIPNLHLAQRARRRRRVGRLPQGAGAPVAGRARRRRRRRAVAARAREVRVRHPRLLIGGESAGGYMTAVVGAARARRARRDRPRRRLQHRVRRARLGPVAQPARPASARRLRHARSRGHRVHRRMLPARPHARASDARRRSHRPSPICAACRRAFVSVGTCDHLLDDSLLFASTARAAAGVDVELFVAPELPHTFMLFDCGIDEALGRSHE